METLNPNAVHDEAMTPGQRIADAVAGGMGSWTFIILQTIFVGIWIVLNSVAWTYHWDTFPYILMNLLFSTQAAYAAPVIMMAQNRQSQKDRIKAELDYQVNIRAEQEIREIRTGVRKLLGVTEE